MEKGNKQVRILHIVTGIGVGGVSVFLYNYYKNMNRENVHFDCMAIDTGKEQFFADALRKLGAGVYYMPKNYLKRFLFLSKFLLTHKYDIVHSHIELPSAIYLLLAKLSGVRIRIAHAHMAYCDYSSLKHRTMQWILNKVATHRWGCSTDALRGLFGERYVDADNVIYNAMNIDAFVYDENIRKKYREELGIDDKYVMGFVGRLTPLKNIPYLTDIFYEIKKRIPNAVFLVCGDGELRGQMLDYINRLNISDSVIMLGARNDVSSLMQAMDVFVLPSLCEGLGIVLIEAQAVSLRCVASKDTIPQATRISDYIDYISITEKPEVWARFIYENCRSYERKDMRMNLVNACYDIKTEAPKLEKRYLDLVYIR